MRVAARQRIHFPPKVDPIVPAFEAEIPQADRGALLLALARSALAEVLLAAPRAELPPEPWLERKAASFVTLTVGGRLRGCRGSLEATRSLREDVGANAVAAALDDPRFPPVSAAELERARVEVSLLGALEPLPVASEADALARLRPGVDGLVLEHAGGRGTFLPQVWEQIPKPRDFLAELRLKAGLDRKAWSEDMRLLRYTVTKWREAGSGREAMPGREPGTGGA